MNLFGSCRHMRPVKLLLILICSSLVSVTYAQPTTQNTKYLISDVRVFDGNSPKLSPLTKVMLENQLISGIGPELTADADTVVIDGGERVLMPGLIEGHGHLSIVRPLGEIAHQRTWDYLGSVMGVEAERYLMRGFTSFRDAGGPVFGLKQAIDEGLVIGPRIFPSGAGISQTSGHADLRDYNEKSSYFSGDRPNAMQQMGYAFLADGVAEVQKATRENLRLGASQIKVLAGGGVTSLFDPLLSTQYTLEELKAAVAEADRWGTYVTVHAHADEAIKQAIEAGVKTIEHSTLISEATIKAIAKNDMYLIPSTAIGLIPRPKHDPVFSNPAQVRKMNMVKGGMENVYRLAQKHKVKIGWGSDMFGIRAAFDAVPLEFHYRGLFVKPAQQLKQVTGINGEILALTGRRNPYPLGKIGMMEKGAYADLLIVEGNPLENIEVLVKPEENLRLIMKDGKVFKNTLEL